MSLDELKGKANEAAGKMNDDEKQELKGKAQQELGKAKDKADEVTEDLAGKVNDKLDRKDDR